jgi:hypothetical protein
MSFSNLFTESPVFTKEELERRIADLKNRWQRTPALEPDQYILSPRAYDIIRRLEDELGIPDSERMTARKRQEGQHG